MFLGPEEAVPAPKVPRISKADMNLMKAKDLAPVELHHFAGQKKPVPPAVEIHEGMPFPLLKKLQESIEVAYNLDLSWLVDVIRTTEGESPQAEWSGYMSSVARLKEEEPGSATRFLFGPLIDAPPSHPDTVLTTLLYIEWFMKQHNVNNCHVSADMQLYKVVMQIKRSYPDRWRHLIVRPGGMHVLMSFVGCIGNLMCSSGLEEILNAGFKGVANMLLGKVWPKALRGLRMVVEALLQPFIISGATTLSSLEEVLENARGSRTGRLWVDCLIKPVSILLLYIRAEREGNWLLHLHSLQRMLPYFFAAGHWNYARYLQWHLTDMASLPENVLQAFLKGEHVCRHRQGTWNALF